MNMDFHRVFIFYQSQHENVMGISSMISFLADSSQHSNTLILDRGKFHSNVTSNISSTLTYYSPHSLLEMFATPLF